MAACSSYPMTGLELTYKLVEKDISQKSDIIILLVHWLLILEKKFKCVGLGNEKTLTQIDRASASDLLPDGWNQSDVYLIRYIKNDVLYVLSGSKSNEQFIVNFLYVEGEVASNIVIHIDDTIKDLYQPITKIFANQRDLIERIKTELIDASNDTECKQSTFELMSNPYSFDNMSTPYYPFNNIDTEYSIATTFNRTSHYGHQSRGFPYDRFLANHYRTNGINRYRCRSGRSRSSRSRAHPSSARRHRRNHFQH